MKPAFHPGRCLFAQFLGRGCCCPLVPRKLCSICLARILPKQAEQRIKMESQPLRMPTNQSLHQSWLSPREPREPTLTADCREEGSFRLASSASRVDHSKVKRQVCLRQQPKAAFDKKEPLRSFGLSWLHAWRFRHGSEAFFTHVQRFGP